MIIIKKIDNKLFILLIHLVFISIIGYLDFVTLPEFSFSFFYLIPISSLSLYRNTKLYSVILLSVLSALFWFLADYNTREYTSILFPLWNAFVRLSIFTSIGLLILYLKDKHKKLLLANTKLKQMNEEKNKFIGITAHDIRSPINGIYAFSDLLIDDHKDTMHPELLEGLTLIKKICNNTLVILKNLLDISKIESGIVDLNLRNQDYLLFAKEKVSLNQIISKHKDITIRLHSQLDGIVTDFDEHYLSEVLDNLLSNAIKYSPRGSEISVQISIKDKNRILTEVIDQGKGIPEAEQKKLFNYFQTTSTQPTEGEKSTGLGLAIAKKIVTLHNGEIGLKSDPGKGSVFYFTLPIK